MATAISSRLVTPRRIGGVGDMERIKRFLSLLRSIVPVLWHQSVAPIVHWHIVSLFSAEEYKVVFEELHSAHLKYARRLKSKRTALIRKRDKGGKFI